MAQRVTIDVIARHIQANPDSSNEEISESIYIASSSLHLYLTEMINAGILTRRRDKRMYRYTIVPGMYVERDNRPAETDESVSRAKAAEALAMDLKERGLFRRAATVLTEVIGMMRTEREVQRVSALRHDCLACAKRLPQGLTQ